MRPEFFERAGLELECSHSILMSHPRLNPGFALAFVSGVYAERWPTAGESALTNALSIAASPDWAGTVRARFGKLRDIAGQPYSLSERQLCRVLDESSFRGDHWSKLMNVFTKATGDEKLVFFVYGPNRDRTIVVTNDRYIRTWRRATADDWRGAAIRYRLEEVD